MTANLFLERTFDEPLTPEDVLEGGRESAQCLDLHRVRWHGSFLALDGRTMICTFSAPDLESARLALRDPDTDLSRLWSGTVYPGTNGTTPNVVVERSFAAPVRYEDIKALGDAKAWCLETYNVTYSHTFFSLDRSACCASTRRPTPKPCAASNARPARPSAPSGRAHPSYPGQR